MPRSYAAVRVAALTALLALSGCSVGPKYQTPTVQTPSAYKEPTAQNVYEPEPWKIAQPSDAAIPGKWWEIFGDPDLNALEEKVNVSNQNVASVSREFSRGPRFSEAGPRAVLSDRRGESQHHRMRGLPPRNSAGSSPRVPRLPAPASLSPRLHPFRCRLTLPGSPISGAAFATRSTPMSSPRRPAPPTSKTCA